MKILLLNSTDAGGGAANAARRLCDALNDKGVSATLFVEKKLTESINVDVLPRKKLYWLHKIGRFLENRLINLAMHTTNKILHTIDYQTVSDVSWINDSDYDIVHLHWINGTVSIEDIAKINKPIVWSLHDSWPCCGAEHHPNVLEEDNRWTEGYYQSNKPSTTKGIDICRVVWEKKKRLLQNKEIVFIAPSKWEHDVLKNSKLFGNKICYKISNLLPYSIFYPRDKMNERKKKGLPLNKKVIGFGAANQMDDPRSMKGTYYFIKALEKIKNKQEYYVLIFGPATDKFTNRIPMQFYAAGFVSDLDEMACLYSCCDCFVNSSLIENLSYTAYESIACQIPVVAFNIGGITDIVKNRVNGYLATPYKVDELVDGIEYCIDNFALLSNNCNMIHDDFNQDDIINKHIELYTALLKRKEM